MSDDYEPIYYKSMDLTELTGQELLARVADVLYAAPPGAKPYVDITFYNSWSEPRVMRLELVSGPERSPSVH